MCIVLINSQIKSNKRMIKCIMECFGKWMRVTVYLNSLKLLAKSERFWIETSLHWKNYLYLLGEVSKLSELSCLHVNGTEDLELLRYSCSQALWHPLFLHWEVWPSQWRTTDHSQQVLEGNPSKDCNRASNHNIGQHTDFMLSHSWWLLGILCGSSPSGASVQLRPSP